MNEMLDKSPLTEAVYYILLSVLKPLHGYGIMQNVKEMSNERVSIGPGTLYGAINTLLEKGWIVPVEKDEESRKKLYKITESGYERLNIEIQRLEDALIQGKSKLMEVEL